MPLKHILILVLVAAAWGLNYVAIKAGLESIPPMMFSALRFFAVLFPAILLIRKPAVPLWKLALYGMVMFVCQQGLLFSAMHVGLSAGLASLLFQVQVFFTIGLAAVFLKDRPRLVQIAGALVAAGGVAVVGFHTGGEVTLAGLGLLILAALSGSAGNVLARTLGAGVDMFGVVVWASLFAFPPLALLSLAVEGRTVIMQSFAAMDMTAWLSVAYVAYLTTFMGYALWIRMLAQHSAAAVMPFALLTPVFGLLGATILLGEAWPAWKLCATLLIIGGLCLNQLNNVTLLGQAGGTERR
ncbi:MAG: EamA family transporter [Pseudomonadota bacterium]|nr:EamA family transporter [Pseudomonadota bacterium]